MEIIIEQIKIFTPEITQTLNNLLLQLNPASKMLNDEDVERIVGTPSTRLLAAKDPVNNKIIGMLTLVLLIAPSAKKGLLEDLVVDKNYRGKGIGKKLIDFAIGLAREEGAVRLEFTSNPKRVEANNLYQSLGFKIRDTNVYRIEL